LVTVQPGARRAESNYCTTAALRLLKQVILMEDNMLHNHVVKHKLLASVMVLFEEVRTVNNLTNSALLDLFRIIRAVRHQPFDIYYGTT